MAGRCHARPDLVGLLYGPHVTLYVYRCPRCHGTVRLAVAITPVPLHGECGPMVLETGEARVLLPMDPERTNAGRVQTGEVAPLKVEALRAAGILLPETQHALEWLYRHRATNGMAEAFCKVGGRRCIDLVAFARLIRERKA